MKVKLLDGTDFNLKYKGNSILNYDMNKNDLNGHFYGGDKIEELTFYYEILVDRTSVEIFADHGKFCVIEPLHKARNENGFEFELNWPAIDIEELEVNTIKSIW